MCGRQIETQESDFVEKGGFTEKLYRVRSQLSVSL
jgi:four helix bundle suffix protein